METHQFSSIIYTDITIHKLLKCSCFQILHYYEDGGPKVNLPLCKTDPHKKVARTWPATSLSMLGTHLPMVQANWDWGMDWSICSRCCICLSHLCNEWINLKKKNYTTTKKKCSFKRLNIFGTVDDFLHWVLWISVSEASESKTCTIKPPLLHKILVL